ncbi:O-antigen ligase family protein [Marinilabilia rubra]|uniref:O-antigen ligase-related domain-containing protein n=1 Tax=Marinilabilia rubra TaxID=2162893 RepID=A0A2U2B4M9_9BACT|nr:O-antigen ligase family protein [Marinilabilia rubra]PWD98015.1 hypothetical protein DDZ16_17585 [Marinilabilia rubra]
MVPEKTKTSILIAYHLVLGLVGASMPVLITLSYLGAFMFFVIDVIISRDRNSRAGFFALYLMSFEIVYRMGGEVISWEFGKYTSSLMLLTGIIAKERKHIPLIFLGLFLLLVPSFFLSEADESGRLRSMIMFNFSGPLSLVLSGFYFYQRAVSKKQLLNGLWISFLPAFALIVLMSIRAGLGSLEFESVQSNTDTAGGFAANQVSSILGWFVLLGLILKIFGNSITPFGWADWIIIGLLLMRGLLTFSRGGMLSFVFSLIVGLTIYFYYDYRFRRVVLKYLSKIVVGFLFLVVVVFYANSLTDNYLLYRYEGKTTNEVQTGQLSRERDLLTGRGKIMKGDLDAFKEYPVFGVGYGMASEWHARYFGHLAAAHTEYARLLSEHGILGLLYLIIAFIVLPFRQYHFIKSGSNKFLFISFFLISVLTMFHSAMRLAMPGIVYGLSFIVISGSARENNRSLSDHRS